MKNPGSLLVSLTLIINISVIAFGQGVSGSIEGIVADPAGAIIPGATVKAESIGTTTAFNQTVTTDKNGYFAFPKVAPGKYEVTISNNGFSKTTWAVNVVVDKAAMMRANLVVINSPPLVTNELEESPFDETETKIDTNITKELTEKLPKGTTFTSLLKIAPNVRMEPLAGGFQIDGASGSDNTFFIDGQEVTNFARGILNTNNDLPFELLREVQVKSTGFEAQDSGSTGGVVNVVTAGGTEQWHGNFGISFRSSKLQGNPNPILTSFGVGPGEFEYFQPNKDKGTDYFPYASISGPILKDKVWGMIAYAPQISKTRRIKDYFDTSSPNRSVLTTETYQATTRTEQAFARIDAQPFSKLRLFGTYLWNPTIADGELPAELISIGNPPITVSEYANRGGRVNSNLVNGQARYNPLSWMLINVRAGRSFLNEKIDSYGRNGGTRFAVSTGSPLDPCNPGDINIPGRTSECRGFNTGSNSINHLDVSTRSTFDIDADFIGINFFGRHNIRGGYQINDLYSDIDSGYANTGYVLLYYGRSIVEFTGFAVTPLPFCDFQNIPAGSNDCTLGTARIVRIGTFGEARSENDALYAQDSWQIWNRLTVNVGLRLESEVGPSFTESSQSTEIKFGWKDKIAPRFGTAFDLFGDGKTRVFGSYGWFYDRIKHELARRSVGSSLFLDGFAQITPGRGLSPFDYTIEAMLGGRGLILGGECPIANRTGYVECELDRRVSNIPVQPFPPFAVDPTLKPMRQREYTFGLEHQIGKKFIVAGRYTRKQLDRAVEDLSVYSSAGSEGSFIGNPGQGVACEISTLSNLPCTEAERNYDALEFHIDMRDAKYFFNATYTYSRLFGNYSGLASSDEFGRNSPNSNRFFDQPSAGYNANGVADNGRLATDRPHVFKVYGGYSLDWGNNAKHITNFSVFSTFQSGTPLTTRYNLYNINSSILFGRGDLGRTEMFTETDLAASHRYKFGRDGRFTLEPFVEIRNLFDENNEIGRDTAFGNVNLTATQLVTGGCTTCADRFSVYEAIFNGVGIQQFITNFYNNNPTSTNNSYNQPNSFQIGRDVRFGFRFRF